MIYLLGHLMSVLALMHAANFETVHQAVMFKTLNQGFPISKIYQEITKGMLVDQLK